MTAVQEYRSIEEDELNYDLALPFVSSAIMLAFVVTVAARWSRRRHLHLLF